jgi:hypothetical protein
VLTVAGCGFELLDGALQPFMMGRGEGPKLNADAVPAGPADDGTLDQDRGPSFMEVEQKIHMHSGDGSQGTFKPTAFTREIQRLADLMKSILMDEGAGKGCGKSGILSDYHNATLFCSPPAGCRKRTLWGGMQM